MEVIGEQRDRAAGWSLLGHAVVCVAVCLCFSLFVPLAHAGFLYHLEDASPFGGLSGPAACLTRPSWGSFTGAVEKTQPSDCGPI
jgi:hypothetical protein